jgi:hypothetical protein
MAPTLPGYKIFENSAVVTTAASPLLSAWIDTTGFTIVVPWFTFAGGTTVFTVEGNFDGVSAADADFNYASLTSGTAFTVISPFIRFRLVQTVADATKSKIFIQVRA